LSRPACCEEVCQDLRCFAGDNFVETFVETFIDSQARTLSIGLLPIGLLSFVETFVKFADWFVETLSSLRRPCRKVCPGDLR
jgi:hypothetical protein